MNIVLKYSSNIHEQFHEILMNIVLKYSSNIHEQFHENFMNIVPEMFMNSFMRIS